MNRAVLVSVTTTLLVGCGSGNGLTGGAGSGGHGGGGTGDAGNVAGAKGAGAGGGTGGFAGNVDASSGVAGRGGGAGGAAGSTGGGVGGAAGRADGAAGDAGGAAGSAGTVELAVPARPCTSASFSGPQTAQRAHRIARSPYSGLATWSPIWHASRPHRLSRPVKLLYVATTARTAKKAISALNVLRNGVTEAGVDALPELFWYRLAYLIERRGRRIAHQATALLDAQRLP